jgi:hypothetical protein
MRPRAYRGDRAPLDPRRVGDSDDRRFRAWRITLFQQADAGDLAVFGGPPLECRLLLFQVTVATGQKVGESLGVR